MPGEVSSSTSPFRRGRLQSVLSCPFGIILNYKIYIVSKTKTERR
jgi:hypothetical protein